MGENDYNVAEPTFEEFVKNLRRSDIIKKQLNKDSLPSEVERVLRDAMKLNGLKKLGDQLINLFQGEIRKGLRALGPVKESMPVEPEVDMINEAGLGTQLGGHSKTKVHPSNRNKDGIGASQADWIMKQIRDQLLSDKKGENALELVYKMVNTPKPGSSPKVKKDYDEDLRQTYKKVIAPRPY